MIEDHAQTCRLIATVLRRMRPDAEVLELATHADADAALAAGAPTGVLVDEYLADGALGSAWIVRHRAALAAAYVLVFTGDRLESEASFALFHLGIEHVYKPIGGEVLTDFCDRCRSGAQVSPSVEAVIADLAARSCLTRTHQEIVRLFVRGYDSAAVARELGIKRSTLKTHVKTICRRAFCASMRDLVGRIFDGLSPVWTRPPPPDPPRGTLSERLAQVPGARRR